MKKSLLLLTMAMLFCFMTRAQYIKGEFLLGGNFDYQNLKSNYYNYNNTLKDESIVINFSIGKVFNNNLLAGINLSYGSFNQKYLNPAVSPDRTIRSYGAGILIRKYKPFFKGLNLFMETSLNYTYSKTVDSLPTPYPQRLVVQYSESLSFSPGISYRLSKKWDVEIFIPNVMNTSLSHTKFNDSGNYYQTQFNFKSSLNTFNLQMIGIGFHYII